MRRVVAYSTLATAYARQPQGRKNAIYLRIIIRINGVFPAPEATWRLRSRVE